MHHEICKSINGYSNAYIQPEIIAVHHSEHDTQPARDSKNEEKCIVAFKYMIMRFVMITVQHPQKAVHHIFMREPRHELHEEKSGNDNAGIDQPAHNSNRLQCQEKEGHFNE